MLLCEIGVWVLVLKKDLYRGEDEAEVGDKWGPARCKEWVFPEVKGLGGVRPPGGWRKMRRMWMTGGCG